jgi:predicted dehydrogenase
LANPLDIEVRYGSYGPLDKIMNHLQSSKEIIYTQIAGMSKGKRPSETYFREDRAFIDAVLKGNTPLVSADDGIHVLKVLEAIKESIDKKKIVKVN